MITSAKSKELIVLVGVHSTPFGAPAVGYWAAGHSRSSWEAVASLLRRRFDVLTVHAPLEGSGANITAGNPGIRAEAIRQVRRTVEFAATTGADAVVVHHGWPAAFASAEEFFEQSRRALEEAWEERAYWPDGSVKWTFLHARGPAGENGLVLSTTDSEASDSRASVKVITYRGGFLDNLGVG